MADKDKKKNDSRQTQIDALYQWLSYDLQKTKEELLSELKLSSTQIGFLYKGIKEQKDTSSDAMAQEIRYSYKQNQTIYDGLANLLKNDVVVKLNAVQEKLAALEQLQAIMSELGDLKYGYMQLQSLYENVSSTLSGEVAPKLTSLEETLAADTQKVLDALATVGVSKEDIQSIVDGVSDNVNACTQQVLDVTVTKEEMQELVEACAGVHSQQILEAVAAIPTAENVDYTRISEEVGDKLLELLNELKATESVAAESAVAPVVEPAVAQAEIDYEKVAGDTAAKVVESLPYHEPVDYDRIQAMIDAAVAKQMSALTVATPAPQVDAASVAAAIVSAIDAETLADAVAAKIVVPETITVDYDAVADCVLEKLAAKGISADVVVDEEGIEKIADTVAEKVGKVECAPVQAGMSDEDVEKIVDGVAEELRNMTLVCEYTEEAPATETVEEEIAEEPVEEAEEEAVEEEAAPAQEELAAASEPVFEEDTEGQLIDAETGLVVRLKRSFTAKMRQSEQQVKAYYSDIKNALTSYKKIHSNVSWHGDRFNLGRDTVAKMGINGKTLCFYLDLDPNDPELKTTVYHQKNVGDQKAYESTPFMVKIKSDAAAKKALRLVELLASKLGVEPDEDFQEVDYVTEYAYASTKSLYEQGDIKATKEKKVDFNF